MDSNQELRKALLEAKDKLDGVDLVQLAGDECTNEVPNEAREAEEAREADFEDYLGNRREGEPHGDAVLLEGLDW